MPIYEYECGQCGHRLEALQKISEAPLKKCPECGSNGLSKLVSAAGFRLKGGGWYETDFKSGKKKNVSGDGDGDGKSAGGDGGSSSSDTTGAGEKSSGDGSKGSDAGKSGDSKSPAKSKAGDSGTAKKSGKDGAKR